jgi:hypothetical protein
MIRKKKTILDSKTSKRIFNLAKDQQEELDALDDDDEDEDDNMARFSSHRAQNSDSDGNNDADEGDSGEDVDDDFVNAYPAVHRSSFLMFNSNSIQPTWKHWMHCCPLALEIGKLLPISYFPRLRRKEETSHPFIILVKVRITTIEMDLI